MIAKMNSYSDWIKETRADVLRSYYEKLLQDCGFTVLRIVEHYFKPQGYTALFLLSESHFAIHTFPEQNKTYIELSSCVDAPFEAFGALHKIK